MTIPELYLPEHQIPKPESRKVAMATSPQVLNSSLRVQGLGFRIRGLGRGALVFRVLKDLGFEAFGMCARTLYLVL